MGQIDIKGIIPPVVTPFDDGEEINEKLLAEEIQLLSSVGVDGFAFGGSTGEGAVLSDDELARGIKIVKRENYRGLPVICGVIRNSTRDAVRTGLAVKNAGADALMVTPTHYYGTTDKGNYCFYKEVSDEVGLPVIVYNVIANNPITPEVMSRLSELDMVIGIKQSYGTMHSLNDMVRLCGDKTKVFSAQDDLLFLSYLLGTCGAISAVLTIFPQLCVKQWKAVKENDLETAREIHKRILPVWKMVEGQHFPGQIKTVLNLMGRKVGKARRPILEKTPEEIEEIKEILLDLEFIR